jgi:uncharacterized protein YprB with RNaseH-like and TPR domain
MKDELEGSSHGLFEVLLWFSFNREDYHKDLFHHNLFPIQDLTTLLPNTNQKISSVQACQRQLPAE